MLVTYQEYIQYIVETTYNTLHQNPTVNKTLKVTKLNFLRSSAVKHVLL